MGERDRGDGGRDRQGHPGKREAGVAGADPHADQLHAGVFRRLDYAGAIREATTQEMERDPRVFVYGIGVPTVVDLRHDQGPAEKFGKERCFDTPISEDAMTGFGLGAAIRGLRPIRIHIRVDFMILATNQLINMVSNYTYSTGKLGVPLVVRAIIGRGWGKGAQHSRACSRTSPTFPD